MSNYNSTLQSNNTDLQSILSTINGLPNVTVQVTPSITVNASGLITATAGTKTSTHQLAFQAAKTITPGAANQTAASSGYYTGGDIIVAGDSDLVPSNIKSGVNIFGVTGTYEGSGGDGAKSEDAIIMKTISSYTNDRVTTIGSYTFYNCQSLTAASFSSATTIGSNAFFSCAKLTTVSFPVCTSIGKEVFRDCNRLTTVSFPVCTSMNSYVFEGCTDLQAAIFPVCANVGSYAFNYCTKLTTVSFPVCTSIGTSAFGNCKSLTTVSFPVCTYIGGSAFRSCSSLTSIYLMASSVCTLANSNAFSSAGIGSYKGYIYVPSSLVSSYKTATNWTYFSNRIFSAP